MLLEYFTKGTEETVTGGHIGCEIETDFVDAANGKPISLPVSRAILADCSGRPSGCEHKLELGRQKIELAIGPCAGSDELLNLALASLDWLYRTAARYDARPVFTPVLKWSGSLLDTTIDPRDQTWLQLDGHEALEQLCHCSSVQFTVNINPADAIKAVNALWEARVHQLDYPNDWRWESYILLSYANYRRDRYAGPPGFDSMVDYVGQLAQHRVVMHQGQMAYLDPMLVPDLDVNLYLRSIWWHHRLRRYGDTLAVEIRPFARRTDDCLETYWRKVSSVLGL